MSRGFTLVELMVAVTIVAVLAGIAGVSYKRYTNKGRTTEVMALIAEIKTKEEAYRAENGAYLSTTNVGEDDFFPALIPGSEPKPKLLGTPPAGWTAVGIAPQRSQLYCGYVVVAGPANSFTGPTASAGTEGQALFGGTAPTVPWFYIRATCDNDNNNTLNATWITAFNRTTVIDKNENK